MKKQKRDPLNRAFNHGYRAAKTGRSIESCPHQSQATRFQWTSGWREGKQATWQGFTGVAGLHEYSV